jgi:hypothetical protein
MRRAERPAVGERAVFDLAGDRRDHGHFEQLRRRERRKNGRQPRREHRFPRSGCPPAAATSSARLALSCPLMSLRSTSGSEKSRTFGCGRASTCVPRKWFASWMSEEAAMICISGLAQAASAPQAAGQMRPSLRALAPIAAGSTPATAANRAVEPKLTQHRESRKRVGGNGADRRHEAERDGKIVVATFLG